jgi:hypothetical protein
MEVRARVVEFSASNGFGKVQLEDGEIVAFDLAACRGVPAPPVGETVRVLLGAGYRGRRIVRELTYAPAVVTDRRAGILLQLSPAGGRVRLDRAVGELVECLFPPAAWQGGDAFFGVAVQVTLRASQGAAACPEVVRVVCADIGSTAHRHLLEQVHPLRAHAFDSDPAGASGEQADAEPLTPSPTEFPLLADGGRILRQLRPIASCDLCGTPAAGRHAGERLFVCDACVLAGKLRSYRRLDLERHLRAQHAHDSAADLETLAAALAGALNRTPRVLGYPMYPNWPICCDRPAPFIGVPRRMESFAALVDAGCLCYEAGTSWPHDDVSHWSAVFCFQCTSCGQRFATYRQFLPA